MSRILALRHRARGASRANSPEASAWMEPDRLKGASRISSEHRYAVTYQKHQNRLLEVPTGSARRYTTYIPKQLGSFREGQ